jgi:hypothetical protein
VAHIARALGLVALLFISAAPIAAGQRTSPAAVTGTWAFGVEALGGMAGSALGIAIVLAVAKPNDCPSDDDVACTLQKLGITGVVGAAAGAAVGVGLEHFITEEMNQSLGDSATVVLFSVTQGIVAAAGSRLGTRLRRN